MKLRSVSKKNSIEIILKNIGVHEKSIEILKNKSKLIYLIIEDIKSSTALILKQELLSIGSDAAIHKDIICKKIENSSILLICRYDHLIKLIEKLKKQPFSELNKIQKQLDTFINKKNISKLLIDDKYFDITKTPLIMGILNVTPDSFSDGGKYNNIDKAIEHVEKMIQDGADIIDIGGESTRPGAKKVSEKEEYKRVIPIIKEMKKRFNIPISIDTSKHYIAKAAFDNGANMLNDISGLKSSKILDIIAEYKPTVCIMHMKGVPSSMQLNPEYDKNIIYEIYDFLEDAVEKAVNSGLTKEKCIIDPGIGFGKTLTHNLQILKYIDSFKFMNCPILLGTSRKSMIGAITNNNVDNRLSGSLATIASTFNNVNIYRVHDVKETNDFLKVLNKIDQVN